MVNRKDFRPSSRASKGISDKDRALIKENNKEKFRADYYPQATKEQDESLKRFANRKETVQNKENHSKSNDVNSKIHSKYNSKVERISRRPDNLMSDGNMTHYKITLINKETGKRATYYYSEGSGRSKDTNNERVDSLISSLILDKNTDTADIGYSEKEKKKIDREIAINNVKNERIGVYDFVNSLSEKDQENLSDGYYHGDRN